MTLDADKLDRMAKAGWIRNMELDWPHLQGCMETLNMTSVEMSEWEAQPEALRDNWREQIKAAFVEFGL